MASHGSSQGFIRVLKNPADPPQPGGLSKIELATQTWHSDFLHLPNKDEILVDWILTTFLKERTNAANANPICNVMYWSLLAEILVTAPPHQKTAYARPAKVWLVPLLNRIPFAPVVSTFFSICMSANHSPSEVLIQLFSRCALVIWPMAVQRTNVDALVDCYSFMLAISPAYSSEDATENNFTKFIVLVTSSFRSAFSNTTNKKKFCTTFLQNHLLPWLLCISAMAASTLPAHVSDKQTSSLYSEIYLSGTDVLFSFETLKPGFPSIFSSLSSAFLNSASHNKRPSLSTLPGLFQAYEHAIRRHRYTLLGPGSNHSQDQLVQDKVRDASMKGFLACFEILRKAGVGAEVWDVSVSLLEALEKANIVGSGSAEHLDSLRDIGKLAIDALDDSSHEQNIPRATQAIKVISVLTRIDFDIIARLVPLVLVRLLTVHPSANSNSEALLHILLEYHVKTRTVNTYIGLILGCLTCSSLSTAHQSAHALQEAYRSFASSAVLSITHFNNLMKAVKGFITPGQVQETVHTVFDALKVSWLRYEAAQTASTIPPVIESEDDKKRKVKRRKRDTDASSLNGVNVEAGLAAMSFSLLARAAASVLSALPFSLLSEPSQVTIQSLATDYWNNFLLGALRAGFNSPPQISANNRWSAQVISAATLRLCYALNPTILSCSMQLVASTDGDEDLDDAMLKITKDCGTLPELVVESMRYFFDSRSRTERSRDQSLLIVDTLLEHLSKHLDGVVNMSWSGLSCTLDLLSERGNVCGSLALWHLSLDRWLPIIDEIASKEQMGRFAEMCIILVTSPPHRDKREMTVEWAMKRATSSAAFWELPNLRSALLKLVTREIAFLDTYQMSPLLNRAIKGNQQPTGIVLLKSHQIRAVKNAYELLLLAPMEYLPRSARSDTFRRALIADVAVWVSLGQSDTRTVLRSWLKHMTDAFGFVEILADSSEYIGYLTQENLDSTEDPVEFTSATIGLADAAYRHVIRLAIQGDQKKLLDVLGILIHRGGPKSIDDSPHPNGVSQQNLLCFIDALVSEYPSPENFSASVRQTLEDFCTSIHSQRSSHLSLLTSDEVDFGNILRQVHVIKAWRFYLILRRWLGPNDPLPQDFGTALLTRLTTNSQSVMDSIDMTMRNTFCGEVIALLLEELHSKIDATRRSHLEVFAAAYVFLHSRLMPENSAPCDTYLARTCKKLSTDDFSHLLTLIRESLAASMPLKRDLCALIQLSTLLVREAPDSVSKLTQDHMGECLQIFMSSPTFSRGSASLCLGVLSLIENQCADRPASVRLIDVGLTWSLLAKFLSGSRDHDHHSSKGIFDAIINISSALIRLRRDLVLSTLPLLSVVLRHLLMSMRTIRPQLGAKQSQMVTDTLPWWVSPAEPLAAEEAKAVGRLLTALQAKTMTRRHISTTEKQKAESLARPFSKHAPYVLAAYIEAMNDPLCTLPSSVRKELEPGLFSLCGMMTEHGRDAVMASVLDAGGKATLKMLWKEYEKQRYVGNG